jgi:hypothetical protein
VVIFMVEGATFMVWMLNMVASDYVAFISILLRTYRESERTGNYL